MKINFNTVDEYINGVNSDRKTALIKFRKLCLEILKGYTETMEYGMPCYKRNNAVEVAFASQKNYISLYLMKQEVMKSCQSLLMNLDHGKSCIRFPNISKIDFELVKKLLVSTTTSTDIPC